MASAAPLLRRHRGSSRTDRQDDLAAIGYDEQASHSKLSLLDFLTKSGPVGSMDFNEGGFLEHRLSNLQWRTGSARGARGEVADVDIEKPTPCFSNPIASRAVSCPPIRECNRHRKLWLLSPDLESNLLKIYPQAWRQLQSHAGVVLQCILLLLVVCTYSACPLTVSWAKVVGQDAGGLPIKGRPFKESSVIAVSWGFIATIGLALSWALGGRRAVKECFNRRAMLIFAPAGFGWALADVCEVLAVSRIDPATYGVISQARLLGSATFCWLMLGMDQSRLQWGILAALSVVCMAYCLVPDEEVPNTERLYRWRLAQAEVRIGWAQKHPTGPEPVNMKVQIAGIVFALSKVALSVISGVYAESQFKNAIKEEGQPRGLHVQMTQVSFSSMICAAIGYTVLCLYQGENVYDFFGGPDGSWDYRTWVVAAVYCWREWICNLCVKHFDSLVKNICNAVALVVTYGFTVVGSKEKPFSLLKVMLLLAVVAEVMNYCSTKKKAPEVPASASTSPTNSQQTTPAMRRISTGEFPMIPVAAYKVDARHVDPDAHPAAANPWKRETS